MGMTTFAIAWSYLRAIKKDPITCCVWGIAVNVSPAISLKNNILFGDWTCTICNKLLALQRFVYVRFWILVLPILSRYDLLRHHQQTPQTYVSYGVHLGNIYYMNGLFALPMENWSLPVCSYTKGFASLKYIHKNIIESLLYKNEKIKLVQQTLSTMKTDICLFW